MNNYLQLKVTKVELKLNSILFLFLKGKTVFRKFLKSAICTLVVFN